MKKKWTEYEEKIIIDGISTYPISKFIELLGRNENSIRKKIGHMGLKVMVSENKRPVHEIKNNLNNYDWFEIQNYYDNNKTWRETAKHFNFNQRILTDGRNEGLFISRSKGDATRLSNKLKPRTLSQEHKDKISVGRLKYLKENPDKVPYRLNHSSKGASYPEKYFDDVFSKWDIIYEKELPINRYQLDFAFVEHGINVEIDGEQHYVDTKIIKSNKRRDKFLGELGWSTIRVRWRDFKKQSKTEKERFILDLQKNILLGKNETPEILLNEQKRHCDCGNKISRNAKTCKDCQSLSYRKVIDRPTKEQLINEISNSSYLAVGRKYGVSDNTIRKWIK